MVPITSLESNLHSMEVSTILTALSKILPLVRPHLFANPIRIPLQILKGTHRIQTSVSARQFCQATA
jgi:hypothetical protein